MEFVRDASRDIGTADTPILSGNARRKLVVIVNNGGQTVYLRFWGPPNSAYAAAANTGIRLSMGAAFIMDSTGMFYGDISGISSGGASCNVTAIEVYEQ